MINPAKYYKEVLLSKLTAREIFELLCIIDDGMSDELLESMTGDCRNWFPEEFGDIPPKLGKLVE